MEAIRSGRGVSRLQTPQQDRLSGQVQAITAPITTLVTRAAGIVAG